MKILLSFFEFGEVMLRRAEELYNLKQKLGSHFNLSRADVSRFLDDALKLVTPGMLSHRFESPSELSEFLKNHLNQFRNILKETHFKPEIDLHVDQYEDNLIVLTEKLYKDAMAILNGDPAASSLPEVLICYPGFLAIAAFRLAHYFHTVEIPLLPRIISELAHEKTGIDIHPGAQIGESFFIDHGTGIVIGESAVIGDHVKIYQGVTLGALSVDKSMALTKRHPTIKDHCVIYSHATILGGNTIIGEHSIIGGNVWITKSIAPHSIVYHKSEVKLDSKSITSFEELTYEI